jgi:hypothetical protein
MHDHPAPPAPAPEVQAVATVGGVLTDLVELAEQLPVPPAQAEATARILDRLAEEITDAAGMLRGARPESAPRRADLSPAFPAWRGAGEDERITRARTLLAEHHQPLVMTPGDVRHLLARFQRRTVELLEVIDGAVHDAPDGGGGSS